MKIVILLLLAINIKADKTCSCDDWKCSSNELRKLHFSVCTITEGIEETKTLKEPKHSDVIKDNEINKNNNNNKGFKNLILKGSIIIASATTITICAFVPIIKCCQTFRPREPRADFVQLSSII